MTLLLLIVAIVLFFIIMSKNQKLSARIDDLENKVINLINRFEQAKTPFPDMDG